MNLNGLVLFFLIRPHLCSQIFQGIHIGSINIFRFITGRLHLQNSYPGFLFLCGNVHVFSQPFKGFHSVCQLDGCTVLSVLDLSDQCSINAVRFPEADGVDLLLQWCFLSSNRIFNLNQTELTDDIFFLLTELHKVSDVSKGNVHVFLKDVMFIQKFTVQPGLLHGLDLVSDVSICK